MPLFDAELNRLADSIGDADLTIYLHTEVPTNADPTLGRVVAGGGLYQTGVTLAASDISDGLDGDIMNNVAIAFGTAAADVGVVTHWSSVRGAAPVGYGTLPATTINGGDTFSIDSGTLVFNGSTS